MHPKQHRDEGDQRDDGAQHSADEEVAATAMGGPFDGSVVLAAGNPIS